MVRGVIQTVEGNVDLASLGGKPAPGEYIYSHAKVPSEVRFGEAIHLFMAYVNEFFGGVIPERLECVDKVGGSAMLSKNWKNIPSKGYYSQGNDDGLMGSRFNNNASMNYNALNNNPPMPNITPTNPNQTTTNNPMINSIAMNTPTNTPIYPSQAPGSQQNPISPNLNSNNNYTSFKR